jgi:plastocyanin
VTLFSRRRFAAPLALALAFAVTGCAGDDPPADEATEDTARAEVPETVIEASDYAFTIPDGIAAGLNKIVLRNSGKEPHHAQLARLNDGVTLEQFQAELQKGPGGALPLITLAGGAMTAAPGAESSAIVPLAEGQYVALCFIEGEDHVPHLAKGMVQPFTVGAAGDAEIQSPVADATIEMVDFGFQAQEVEPGAQIVEFINTGEQPHETAIVAIPAEQSDAVDAWLAQPTEQLPLPPMTVGGIQAMVPGMTGFSTVEFEAGSSYLLVCFVPDSGTGKPHFQLGMAERIDVS